MLDLDLALRAAYQILASNMCLIDICVEDFTDWYNEIVVTQGAEIKFQAFDPDSQFNNNNNSRSLNMNI